MVQTKGADAMTTVYIIAVIILNISDYAQVVVADINAALSWDLSGITMFFIGLLLSLIIDAIFGNS